MADHRDPADRAGLRRGLAVPCFAEDPADLIQLGIGAEQAGLDGYFLWDHPVHSDSGERPLTVGPVRFSPSPVQRPRVPIWVGGILPAGGPLARAARWAAGVHPPSGPVTRAARWDGFVPIHPGRPGDRATVGEIAAARDKIAGLRGTTGDFDIAVWGELDPGGRVAARLPGYRDAGATWWLESPGSGPGWLGAVRERLQRGPRVQSRRG